MGITVFKLEALALEFKGSPFQLVRPAVAITTNVELEAPEALQLRPATFGFSAWRRPLSREALGNKASEVVVYDFDTPRQTMRVVQVNRPAAKNAHLPADSQGAAVLVNAVTGEVTVGLVVADGNTLIEMERASIPANIKPVRKGSRRETAYIEAPGSPNYADLAARSATQLGLKSERALADFLIEYVQRSSEYRDQYGGSTAQFLTLLLNSDDATMKLGCLCLGRSSDLGLLLAPSDTGGLQSIRLVGNSQDLSSEGKISGYNPRLLVATAEGLRVPGGLVAMCGDGFRLPPLVVGKQGLEEVLRSPAEEVVALFGGSVALLESADRKYNPHDDGSMVFFVPMPRAVVEEPPVEVVSEESKEVVEVVPEAPAEPVVETAKPAAIPAEAPAAEPEVVGPEAPASEAVEPEAAPTVLPELVAAVTAGQRAALEFITALFNHMGRHVTAEEVAAMTATELAELFHTELAPLMADVARVHEIVRSKRIEPKAFWDWLAAYQQQHQKRPGARSKRRQITGGKSQNAESERK